MSDLNIPVPVKLPPFKAWLASNIPAVYDNTMSYYDELTSLIAWLEKEVVPNVNEAIELVNMLKDYVENYFKNLDVQEEINNKLDQMAEDGTLQEIITTYIQANVAWTFDTVAEMKTATNLVSGSYARTLGFHGLNDGGGAFYYITDTGTANEMDVIAIDTLYAVLVKPSVVTPEMYGAYGDGTHDDKPSIQECINKNSNIAFNEKTYLVSLDTTADELSFVNGITITSNKSVDFRKAKIAIPGVDGGEIEKYSVIKLIGDNIIIKNADIVGDREDHSGTLSEYGHGIRTFRCTNSKILNCTVTKCIGDGICLNAEYTSSEDYICSSKNILIDGCEISYARRNGISNIGCDDLTISNCYVHDISGTSPQACIDIEGNANAREEYPKNTIVHGCRLINEGTSDRGFLVYDRSYDCSVFDCVISSLVYYGKCNVRDVTADTVKNYADDGVVINDADIADLWSTGAEITVNNCNVDKVTINKTSSRTACTVTINDSNLKQFVCATTSPEYTLTFNRCKFDYTSYISFEGNIKYATFNNCILNTVQRIMSSKINTLKMYGCTIHIDNNSATGLIYDTNLSNAELLNNVITGSHTSAFSGTLFNATTLATGRFIGNTCTEIGTWSSGTITSKTVANNYQDSLNN